MSAIGGGGSVLGGGMGGVGGGGSASSTSLPTAEPIEKPKPKRNIKVNTKKYIVIFESFIKIKF